MRPLKALFFTTELGGGGAESHTLRVLNHLDRDRVRPSLALCRLGGSYERFLEPDVEIHSVSFGSLRSSLTRVALAAPGLARLTRSLAPDIVVAVMDLPALVAITTLWAMRQRPKLAVSVQIPPSIEYARSRLGRRFFLPAIKHLYPRADRVIALSQGVKRDLVGVIPSIEPKTVVIHNACVDDRNLADSGPSSDVPVTTRPVILAAGRLTYQKGYPVLIDAFARVRAQVDAELWILGEGPDREAIVSQIRTLGLDSSVTLFGFRDDPQAFMRRATVFALPSRYEGFGNVIAEALACGTPVVATDCPHGPSEILERERGGLLVPVGDAAALADGLTRVLLDGALRERLAEAGRERAKSFSGAVIASEYAAEMERICGRAGSS